MDKMLECWYLDICDNSVICFKKFQMFDICSNVNICICIYIYIYIYIYMYVCMYRQQAA